MLPPLIAACMTMFGASWLINLFMDFMGMAGGNDNSIQHVEVVNIGDFSRK